MTNLPPALLAVLVATLSPPATSLSVDVPTRTMGLRMPNSRPENDETYLCHPVKLDKSG